MLTVPEAARIAGRDPETVRRWIRTGKLRATKVGTQHVIRESDLQEILASEELPVPSSWGEPITGRPLPNVVAIVRRQRAQH